MEAFWAIATSLFFLGASLSGLTLAAIFDATGRYGSGLILRALFLLAAASGLLLLGPYPHWPEPPNEQIPADIAL